MLQDALARLLATAPVAARNKKLENLVQSKAKSFRVGMRLEKGRRGNVTKGQLRKKDYGIVMHVDADDLRRLPKVTVLWMLHGGKLEEPVSIYENQTRVDQLHNYRNATKLWTIEPPQCISYEQLVETWCAHLSLSLSISPLRLIAR